MSRWSDLAEAKAREVRALGHAVLCKRAAIIMPHLDAETAKAMRIAMLAGPGHGLRELVLAHWRAA